MAQLHSKEKLFDRDIRTEEVHQVGAWVLDYYYTLKRLERIKEKSLAVSAEILSIKKYIKSQLFRYPEILDKWSFLRRVNTDG